MKNFWIPITYVWLAVWPLVSQAQVLEDFENGNLNNWTVVAGSPEVVPDEVFAGSNALRMAVSPDGPTLLTHDSFNGAFGRYTVHFFCEGPFPDFNFFFQYQGVENFYQVSCKPEGTDNPELRLIRQEGGEVVDLAVVGASFVTGEWYELMVERTCDLQIRLFIDGIEQVSVFDDAFQSGGTVALGAWAETVYADQLSFEPFRAEVEIVGDPTFCYDPIVLEASGFFSAYQWSTGSTAQRVTVGQEGMIWLEVTDENGCKGRDTVEVSSFCPSLFFAPNIFSPNFDGVNDEFRIFVQRPPVEFYLRVFNRWGELVFEARDPEVGWNGQYRGKTAPSDTYIWQADLDGFLLTGDISLIR